MNDLKNIKKLFNSYYANTYKRWRVNNEKAGKDIVGEEFEKHRVNVWKYYGLTARPGKIANYNADLIIKRGDKIIAIEECKGHYTDACFFKRFLFNAAEVIDLYLQNDEEPPYIILSCPTSFNTYQTKFNNGVKLYERKIRNELKKKVIYLPYCNHDRVKKNKYFKNNINCFNLSDTLITEQIKFIKKL